jgi:carboxyl-terminal processing protease
VAAAGTLHPGALASPPATTRAAALVVTLGWAVACREPAPVPDPGPAVVAEHEDRAAPPALDPSAEACRDWSTLDLAELPPLTEGRQAALLDQVWRRVLEEHYDPTLGCRNWLALRERYALELPTAATDDEAYAIVDAMLGELGQSHLRLFPPSRSEESMGPASPALVVRWVEEQVVVVESHVEGVPTGAALLAIDGRPLAPLVDEVRARADAHAFPLEVSRAVAARLSCKRGGITRALELSRVGAAEPRTHEVPCFVPEGERVTLGNLRDIPTRVEHRMLDGGVGRLAFNVWMLPMVERVQAAMHELRGQGMRALVLDLRGNPGGVGAMAVPVARMLLSRPASLGTLRFRDFEQALVVEPADDGPEQPTAFTGPVAVLVDEGTASTSEIFVVGLRDLGRITVVGARPSAGAALPSVIEALPGGALLQYVVADHRSPLGTVVEGKGIVPDVMVTETREAFVDGHDPVLEAAHRHLLDQLPAPHR